MPNPTDPTWGTLISLSKRREGIAARVQTSVENLGASFAELEAINHDIRVAHLAQTAQRAPGVPANIDDAGAVMSGISTGLVRIEYTRHGLPGGAPVTWPAPPSFAQRYQEATRALELARAVALAPKSAQEGVAEDA